MSIAATIKKWSSDWATAWELSDLGEEGREALVRDIGINQDILDRVVARGSQGGEELPRLLQALELRREAIRKAYPGVMRDMEVTCTLCMDAQRCRQDLDNGVSPATYRQYCPNERTLAEFREQAALRNTPPE